MPHTTLQLAVAFALSLTGCVDRVIVDQADSGGFGDSEGEYPDSESDTRVELPAPESEPLPPGPEPEPPLPKPECVDETDCAADQTCFEGTCVGTGEFRVSLSWTVVSDFDLHVRTPNGVEVWYGEPDGGSGYLDVDDCVGLECRDDDGVHVENVFFDSAAVRGTYEVWIVNFDGIAEGDFNLEIAGSTSAVFSGSLPGWSDAHSEVYTFEF